MLKINLVGTFVVVLIIYIVFVVFVVLRMFSFQFNIVSPDHVVFLLPFSCRFFTQLTWYSKLVYIVVGTSLSLSLLRGIRTLCGVGCEIIISSSSRLIFHVFSYFSI